MDLKICHLYPDVLNLYGDRGNLMAMCYRLEKRNIHATVDECPIGSALCSDDYDLFFIGGGQDFEQEVLLRDLAGGKSRELRGAIEDHKVVLAICGGYQMLGQYYKTWDGNQMDFIGALDLYTVGTRERMIGNFLFETTEANGAVSIVGFENHSGKTYLGGKCAPLGTIVTGYGNNGEDKTEGCRYLNVFATYSHGPLLPKNPKFCDLILETALKRKYGTSETLAPLDDSFEINAHKYMEQRLRR